MGRRFSVGEMLFSDPAAAVGEKHWRLRGSGKRYLLERMSDDLTSVLKSVLLRPNLFDASFLKVAADNGETLVVGKHYIMSAPDVDSDVDLNLPDSATADVEVGDSITIVVATSGGIGRCTIRTLGSDVLFGSGASGTETFWKFQGDGKEVVFTFIGNGIGVPAWQLGSSRDLAGVSSHMSVDCATTGPLAPFTSAGVGFDQILTADANGAFSADGITPFQDYFAGVLVGNEIGNDRQYHGVWELFQLGDGSNPSKLRRRADWAKTGQTRPGTVVFVERGTLNAGKAYISPGSNGPGDTFDWVVNESRAGASATLEWNWLTAIGATDPGSGNLKGDNATQSSITTLYQSTTTANGMNLQAGLALLKSGDVYIVTEEGDTARFIVFTISGAPVDNTGWWTIPVTVSQNGGALRNNRTQGVQIISS